jgi:tRNA-dihydrouridine synthase B
MDKIKPIKIKNIEVKTPVFLCPMAGITDLPYRTIVASFGANFMYSEMISSVAMVRNSNKTFRMAEVDKATNITAIQLAGSDITTLKEAAKMAEDMGATLVDINMGCPVKKVVNGIAGSALMKEECLVGKIIESLATAINIPVTVKMRLGWDRDSMNSPALAKICENSGASLVTVHGRTRQQFYNGEADWKAIANVKQAVNIPVLANGDIKTEEDAIKALEDSGADGIMIGRGTYGAPWKIAQISHYLTTGEKLPDPSSEQKLKTSLTHYDMLLDYFGKETGLKIARKHLSWYTKGLRNSAALRAEINISEDIEHVKNLVKQCFEQGYSEGLEE